jgi:putative endonuclease
MNSDHLAFGQTSESAAEDLLRRKGYRIVDRNVRMPFGEIDLVAERHGVLVFVEVKARRTAAHGGARYAVTEAKQQRLIRLAAQYLAHRRLGRPVCRFDVVLCTGGSARRSSLEHIEHAFEVPGDQLQW